MSKKVRTAVKVVASSGSSMLTMGREIQTAVRVVVKVVKGYDLKQCRIGMGIVSLAAVGPGRGFWKSPGQFRERLTGDRRLGRAVKTGQYEELIAMIMAIIMQMIEDKGTT